MFLTINEIKEKKVQLEDEILKMIQSFEKDTHTSIDDISLESLQLYGEKKNSKKIKLQILL